MLSVVPVTADRMLPGAIAEPVRRAFGIFHRVSDANATATQTSVNQTRAFASIVEIRRMEITVRDVPMDTMEMPDSVRRKSASLACVQVSLSE